MTGTSSDSSADVETLYAWVVKSMPHLPWPPSIGDWDGTVFVSRRRKIPSPVVESPWTPPPNEGCRHPNDNVIIAPRVSLFKVMAAASYAPLSLFFALVWVTLKLPKHAPCSITVRSVPGKSSFHITQHPCHLCTR